MKKIILLAAICAMYIQAQSQSWNLTGNAGTNASTNFIGTTDASNIKIRTNNIIRMNITSGGKIAIGNFTPVYKLDVKGGSINTDSDYRIGGNIVLSVKGTDNSFIGINSGLLNASGFNNTATGSGALFSNVSGYNNTVMGQSALYYNTGGYQNTAVGRATLYNNTNGNNNTAIGMQALFYNTTASENTAIGNDALLTQFYSNSNTSWVSGNVAVGYAALYANAPTTTTNGKYNTAVGHTALHNNTTGAYNTATGSIALYNNISGDANTATGFKALYSNTTGTNNTATGYSALLSNSNGISNTANGIQSLLFNTTASNNIAIGFSALRVQSYSNGGIAWSSNNVAVGNEALYFNQPTATTNGIENTAIGNFALNANTTGKDNTAIGFNALLLGTSGGNNTAVGMNALYSNGSGSNNTAIGRSALFANTSDYNTAIGYGALNGLIGGQQNVAIGFNSGTASGSPNTSNTISINNSGFLNGASNQAFIGNLSMLWIGGQTTWFTYASDARVKNNVKEDVKGLEFISKLRPVTYNLNITAMREITGNEDTPDYPGKYDVEKIKQSGFIAQEVVKAANETGYNFSGVTTPRNEHELYTMSYSQFVVPLVKAVQELNEELKMQNAELKSEVRSQKLENEKLRIDIAEIKTALGLKEKASDLRPLTSVFLEQNSPNPFNQTTVIRYALSAEHNSGVIVVRDLSGNLVKSIAISNTGKGQVTVNANEFTQGTYTYSLEIAGESVDTKLMVITK